MPGRSVPLGSARPRRNHVKLRSSILAASTVALLAFGAVACAGGTGTEETPGTELETPGATEETPAATEEETPASPSVEETTAPAATESPS